MEGVVKDDKHLVVESVLCTSPKFYRQAVTETRARVWDVSEDRRTPYVKAKIHRGASTQHRKFQRVTEHARCKTLVSHLWELVKVRTQSATDHGTSCQNGPTSFTKNLRLFLARLRSAQRNKTANQTFYNFTETVPLGWTISPTSDKEQWGEWRKPKVRHILPTNVEKGCDISMCVSSQHTPLHSAMTSQTARRGSAGPTTQLPCDKGTFLLRFRTGNFSLSNLTDVSPWQPDSLYWNGQPHMSQKKM